MSQEKPINVKALIEEAQISKDKEAYQLMENTPSIRIGVGARRISPSSLFFFVEIVVKLSTEGTKVDIKKLEQTMRLLKALQKRGYLLTYQDDVNISCETPMESKDVNNEYASARALIRDKGLLI